MLKLTRSSSGHVTQAYSLQAFNHFLVVVVCGKKRVRLSINHLSYFSEITLKEFYFIIIEVVLFYN